MARRIIARFTSLSLVLTMPSPLGVSLAQRPGRTAPPASSVPAPDRCGALASAVLANGKVLRATATTAASLPAHCDVTAELDRRTGADGQSYAIGVHLRLPENWNGRFFFQGGGGSDGVLGDALGNLQGDQAGNALALGYAVASTDGGHANEVNRRADHGGVVSFGWDQRAREDYAGRAQARATQAAKALLLAHYGKAPAYSYWVGCSKGGQEGMAMSARYPGDYDGIMANAPGFALPRAAVAEAWDTQAFARAAQAISALDKDGLPQLGRAFSDGDLALAAGAVLKACDALDGAVDGIVSAYGACTTARVAPLLTATTCATSKTDACLLPVQVAALRRVFEGPRDAHGQPLYSDWAWDRGIGGEGWRAWKLGTFGDGPPSARNVTLGAGSLASVFTTPPTPITDDPATLQRYHLAFSFERDAPRIHATTVGFPRSAWALLGVHSPDRDAFRARGGKLIVVHGASDPVFSINDTARWWDRLNARAGGKAAAFARLFAVPGMNHCRGGPGATRFDAFAALVAWVEDGRPPDRIEATAPPGTPWPGRTRPLCPYPSSARYDGHGPIEQATSFTCAAGARIAAAGGTRD